MLPWLPIRLPICVSSTSCRVPCCIALTCAQPTRRMPSKRGCVEDAPTATGETQDGVRGKWAQLGLGQGMNTGSRDGGHANDRGPNRMTKVLGEGDESSQCRGVRTGELRREGSDRATNVTAVRRVCEEPPARSLLTVPQAWVTGRSGSPLRPSCPVFRCGVGRAVLSPSTASRSGNALVPVGPTVRRAALDPMRSFPGLGWTLQVSVAGNAGKA